jgi:hypothetical protein
MPLSHADLSSRLGFVSCAFRSLGSSAGERTPFLVQRSLAEPLTRVACSVGSARAMSFEACGGKCSQSPLRGFCAVRRACGLGEVSGRCRPRVAARLAGFEGCGEGDGWGPHPTFGTQPESPVCTIPAA